MNLKVLGNIRSEYALLSILVTFLCVVGIVTIYSVTSYSNIQNNIWILKDSIFQAGYCLIGALIAFLFARGENISNLSRSLKIGFWAFCLALVICVVLFGTEVNGAKRWLSIGGFSIQPSEFLKVAILIQVVEICNDYKQNNMSSTWLFKQLGFFVIAPLLLLLITQRDLGTTLICIFMVYVVLYMSGFNVALLAISLGVVTLLGIIFIFGSGDFRSGRFVFLDPWNDGQQGYGAGYNIIRSYYAISSGGLFGTGLGGSHEKYDYLYAADNDFIFAIICEESGLIGGLIVLFVIFGIFLISNKIAQNTQLDYNKILIYGAASTLLFQSLLNIGCTVGVLPTTGKPLPFISSGGSAMIASFMLLGIIFNAKNPSISEREAKRRRDNINIITTNFSQSYSRVQNATRTSQSRSTGSKYTSSRQYKNNNPRNNYKSNK